MKLSSLIKGVEIKQTLNFKNINITNLSIRADEIEKNGLFFAIKGNNFDGSNFISQAILHGAKAVVCEKEIKGVDIAGIRIVDIRATLAMISKTFFI